MGWFTQRRNTSDTGEARDEEHADEEDGKQEYEGEDEDEMNGEEEIEEESTTSCCGRVCVCLQVWPWIAMAAIALLITGLVMWASTTSPALGKTKDAFEIAGAEIGNVVAVANGFIAIMTSLSAIMIAVVTFIAISRFELDIFERKLDPRRFRYLATQTVGVFTLILLSVIFIGMCVSLHNEATQTHMQA